MQGSEIASGGEVDQFEQVARFRRALLARHASN